MGQVRTYFDVRNPWEDFDVYILPPDFDWCFVVTHHDACFLARPRDTSNDDADSAGVGGANSPS